MSEFIFKRGNSGIIKMLIKDQDGVIVQDLGSASEATFEIKATEEGLAIFTKTKSGGHILVDTPSTGYVQITMTPTDMDQIPRRYYCGLKIEWPGSITYEVHIFVDGIETEAFRIEQNIVS